MENNSMEGANSSSHHNQYGAISDENTGLISCLALVGAAAVVANAFVLANSILNRNLHVYPFDKLVASLAFAELLTGALGVPVIIIIYQAEYVIPSAPVNYWKLKVFWGGVDVLTIVTVWHVLYITVDRYLAVIRPERYDAKFRWTPFVTAGTWVFAAAIVYAPMIYVYSVGDHSLVHVDHDDVNQKRILQLVYEVIIIHVLHSAPILVSVGLNVRILMACMMAENEEAAAIEASVGEAMKKTVRRVCMSTIVSMTILVTYGPYLAKWQIEVLEPATPPDYKISPTTSMILQVVFALNSAMNPMVIVAQMPAYRYVWTKMKCKRKKYGSASSRTMNVH